MISSPGLSVPLVQPSLAIRLGARPSRFQTVVLPSGPLTSNKRYECGLVYLNSCTVPTKFDRMVLIEHGKRVVCHEQRAAANNQRTAHDECSQLPPHSILPVDVVEPAICRSRVAAQATHMSVGYEYRMDRQMKLSGDQARARRWHACRPFAKDFGPNFGTAAKRRGVP